MKNICSTKTYKFPQKAQKMQENHIQFVIWLWNCIGCNSKIRKYL